ncbi:MAG TPA: VCBS repeat-containing protein, partial [Longimicrobiaceae bacterium]|nr:VCBS repeat-containing protein [Longimicrobiaceae bacterium]
MIRISPVRSFLLLLSFAALQGCRREGMRFRLLSPDRTGVTFANTITTSDSHDLLTDPYIYNGAGVAIGDVDGDGRPDIYLAGNMVSSRLYLNRGGMRFEDVTARAGVGTDRWATGVSMVDIDGDGDLDIYVSVSGPESSTPAERANLLFVNRGVGRDGIPRFTEEAGRYGIADTGFTTNAVFFDYDRDGDLDLFLLGNPPGEFARGETGHRSVSMGADPAGFDQLYRNDGSGTFTNVSEKAGILRILGYGLGVMASDVNRDGWPDLYVSNDMVIPDVLYVNNHDGTFTDRAGEWLGHTSIAGMGIDIADFTNDGWPDIVQNDMVPPDLAGRKWATGGSTVTYGDLLAMRRGGGALQYRENS